MTWKQRYRVASYLRSSLWIVAVAAVVLEQIFAALVRAIDARLDWDALGLGVDGAKALCNTVITFSLSFIVFTFGSLLVAIQVASGQYTPRIIATTLLRDNVIRYTVGLFVFTLLFAVQALNHIEDDRSAVCPCSSRRARSRLPRRVPLSHRLRRAAAAPGEPGEAGR